MSEPRFQIVFRGKLLAGFDTAQVRSNLAKLFRVDEARIGAMLAQPKWVVKAGLDKAQAQRFQEALRDAGMNDTPAAAEPVPTSTPVSTAASVALEQAKAPAPFTPVPAAPIPSTASNVEGQTTQLIASAADTPLAQKPAVAAFEPDLSAFSLAPVGAVLDQHSTKPQAREYDFAQLQLAAPGTQLVEKVPVKPIEIDTSAMRIEPVEVVEKPRSALLKEAG